MVYGCHGRATHHIVVGLHGGYGMLVIVAVHMSTCVGQNLGGMYTAAWMLFDAIVLHTSACCWTGHALGASALLSPRRHNPSVTDRAATLDRRLGRYSGGVALERSDPVTPGV